MIRHRLPDFETLNAELRTIILQNREDSEGIKATNKNGGWHSDYFDGECEEPAVQRLLSHVTRLAPVPARVFMLWANVNTKGQYNAPHRHGAVDEWSGFYVVEAGEPGSGRTVFPSETVEPENGFLTLFPANLEHSVEPYDGSGTRITVAFNLRATP